MPTMDILADVINRLSPFYYYFQIDIGDGIYVTNRTVQIEEIIKGYKKINNFNKLVFDFHLMVKDYESDIIKLEKLKLLLNIKNVFIHFDLHPEYSILTSKYSFPIGLTLNPQDKVNDLATRYTLHDIPAIQIMSVVPGAQGNPFIEETLNKIEQLRVLGYRSKIFLDGAVNDKTLPIINSKKYKPDVICPGSFLAKSPDNELKKRVNYLLEFNNED